ncbi:unnamed protein product, partial [Medioppia subpectinata]
MIMISNPCDTFHNIQCFTKALKVLFAPTDGWGHINACQGMADGLRERGHRAIFAVAAKFAPKLRASGYEVELLTVTAEGQVLTPGAAANQGENNFVAENLEVFKTSAINVVEMYVKLFGDRLCGALRARDTLFREIIGRFRPDVIVVDTYVSSPYIVYSGVPWVWLYSASPLMMLNDSRLPPAWLGLPTVGNTSEWLKHRSQLEVVFKKCYQKVNEWYESEGFPPLKSTSYCNLHPISPYLNIYMTPEELDYKKVQPLAHNWHRVDSFVRTTDETFEIPECLCNWSGKLILLSMGSFGGSHLELMTRLTTILAKSEHRFIVAKGPLHDKYELPNNMWGQKTLPQTAVIPLVDLVLTHGGNNTVTETFYFGKPMLVLPLWADQYDNAQRLQETGLGLRLNPFHCTEEELLTSIDKLVNDSDLAQRMKSIGDRIRESNDKQFLPQFSKYSQRKLTVLFAPTDGWGHINACQGMADGLRERGHRAIFAVAAKFAPKLHASGYEVELLTVTAEGQLPTPGVDANQGENNFVVRNLEVFKTSAINVVEMYVKVFADRLCSKLRAREPLFREIIGRLRPDVIVVDTYISSPYIVYSGVPWVWLYSASPLMMLNDPRLPPA